MAADTQDQNNEKLRNYVHQQPYVTYAFGQSLLKGEDYCLIETNIEFPKKVSSNVKKTSQMEPLDAGKNTTASVVDQTTKFDCFDLYCIMDGHNGKNCAEYLKGAVLKTVLQFLPPGTPVKPDHNKPQEFQQYMQQISKALCNVFFSLDYGFAGEGDFSGSTLTIILRYGWYLTIANVGDSKCVLDSKATILEVTNDHRFQTDQLEKKRAENVPGTHIAKINPYNMQPCKPGEEGAGPMRAWPGGLALSRSIGDFDAGMALVCSPQIVQVQIPPDGVRLILCTDGVWDYWQSSKVAANFIRRTDTINSVQKLVKISASRQGEQRKDDITVLVVDIKGREDASSQELKKQQKAQQRFERSKSVPCFNLFRRKSKPKFQLLEDSVKTYGSQSGYDTNSSGGVDSSGEEDQVVKQMGEKNQLPKEDLFSQLPQAPLILHFIDVAVLQDLTKGLTIAPWSDTDLVKKVDQLQKDALKTWQEKRSEGEPLVYTGQNYDKSEKFSYKNHYNVVSLEEVKKQSSQEAQNQNGEQESLEDQNKETQNQPIKPELDLSEKVFEKQDSGKERRSKEGRGSMNDRKSQGDVNDSIFNQTSFSRDSMTQSLQAYKIKEEFHDSSKNIQQLKQADQK